MAESFAGAEYGEGSKEAHKKSGYRLPDKFYETPEPFDMSTTKAQDAPPDKPKAGKKRKAGPGSNKSRKPVVETKGRK